VAIGQGSRRHRRDLLDILEDRYDTRATIITSQLAPALCMTIWGTRRLPMPSVIGSCTMRIASN
jgi:hypothetical protein